MREVNQPINQSIRGHCLDVDMNMFQLFSVGRAYRGFYRDFGSFLVLVARGHYHVTRWPCCETINRIIG